MNRELVVPPALLGVMAPATSGCGGSGGGSGDAGRPVVAGTTRNTGHTGNTGPAEDGPAPSDPLTSDASAPLNTFFDPPGDTPSGGAQHGERPLRAAQQNNAQDVPVPPPWHGERYTAARSGSTGVQRALNSSTTMQLCELGRV
jgi:hypothetical protein